MNTQETYEMVCERVLDDNGENVDAMGLVSLLVEIIEKE